MLSLNRIERDYLARIIQTSDNGWMQAISVNQIEKYFGLEVSRLQLVDVVPE